MFEKGFCFVPVAYRQESNAKVTYQARKRDRQSKTEQRNFKHASGKHEKLERGRGRQQRGNEHATKTIFFDCMANHFGSWPYLLVKKRFPAFSRNEIQQNTTGNRPKHGEECVKRHASRALY